MAKKGALKSTLIVTSDELKVNGGRWLLQSGPAIRVRGFKESTIGDRKIIGGDALPIYVLAESDARVNGGQFLLKGGQPIQVTDVIGSARGVIQGNAIPVWPVDDDGNYDADFAGAFLPTDVANLILWLRADAITGLADTNPVITWLDESGQGNDVTQGVGADRPLYRTGIMNGLPVVRFDGVSDFLRSAALVTTLPLHIFTVHQMLTAGPFAHLYSGGDATRVRMELGAAPNMVLRNPVVEAVVPSYVLDTPTIFSTLWDGANSQQRVNGGAATIINPGTNTLTAFELAAQTSGFNLGNVDFGEMLCYEAEIFGDNLSSVHTYLSNKWAIALA